MNGMIPQMIARRSILWASLAVLALPAVLQAQFILSTNNGQITIAKYTGSGGVVTIPSTTNGLPVTSIGSYAFIDCSSLTSVTIPNSVTNIGHWAFLDCSSLTGVYFKGNAPRLEGDVFERSAKVKIYHLPETTDWSDTFGGRPTAIWNTQTDAQGNAQSK